MADIRNIKFGDLQVQKIYLGDKLSWIYEAPDTVAPITTVYPDPTDINLTHGAGTKVWLEVNEACNTYYTLDNSTPTTASTLFTEPFTLNETTTIKYFSVDLAGNVETVKTTVFDIIQLPVTTISPSATVQNNIPFTVTLSATNNPTSIHYKLGNSATVYNYSAPFQVNQTSAGVQSPQIKVTYWSVNANGTEAEKIITYDTSGIYPAKPTTPTITNGNNSVTISWSPTLNTTSYTVLRSDTAGGTKTILIPSQYMTGTSYVDSTVTGGQDYYYIVQAGNYGHSTNSDEVVANPTSAPTYNYRYLKIQGYGTSTDATTRIIEFEAWAGSTNTMSTATYLSHETMSNTTKPNINTISNGSKATTSNTYPFWWTPVPNANVVIDLGSQKSLTKLNYYSYSLSGDQRQNRFKILASNTNNGTDWVTLWDMSANTTPQPILPNGYEKIL